MAFRYLAPYRRGLPAGQASSRSSLFDINRQINRMFDDLFEQEGDSGFYERSGISAPAMDIHQSEEEIEITAELPGVKEEDIDLSIDDGVLTLRGEKKTTRQDDETGYRERSYGSFERRITLPSNVAEDKCSANFRDGVLTITLPKVDEKKKGRKIPLGKRNENEDNLIEQEEASDNRTASKAENQNQRESQNA